MANMYVSYLGGVAYGVAKEPIGSEIVVTSGTTAKTAAAAPGAIIAVIFSDTAHYVNTGAFSTVTASAATGIYVPANVERHIALNFGDGVAAITA